MREFRFILGKRALIVFLALLVAMGALLVAPTATQALAEDNTPPINQEASMASVDAGAVEGLLTAANKNGLILDSSVSSLLPPGGRPNGWTLLPVTSPSAPSARYGHAMATTPSGDVLLFGGYNEGNLGDTWLFKYDKTTGTGTWTELSPTTHPPERCYHAMATTPSGVLLFGGMVFYGWSNDTWLFTYDGTGTGTWTMLNDSYDPDAPSGRWWTAMAETPSGDVLLFGGSRENNSLRDTWLFNTATNKWADVTAASPDSANTPAARSFHAMAATPSGVLLYGGYGNGGNLGDTWLYAYGITGTGAWTETNTDHTNTPAARNYHKMAATPWGDALLFGGWSSISLDETWSFTSDDATRTGTWWTKGNHTTTPAARYAHAMAATPSGAILFGGTTSPMDYLGDTWLFGPVTSSLSIAGTQLTIGEQCEITWTSTDLNNTKTITILLARDGVNFTETITTGLPYTATHYAWTVTGPGTINAGIAVRQDVAGDGYQGTSGNSLNHSAFITNGSTEPLVTEAISREFKIAYGYSGTPTTTSDPWLDISGGTGTGTFWVTLLDPALTIIPNLNSKPGEFYRETEFFKETGKRSAFYFDICQQGMSGTLTIVLHYAPRMGDYTFLLYLWNGTGWISVPGILDNTLHTFTFIIDASLLNGTPFALGGDPIAMPGMSPWGLALLSLALLGMGGWWFVRRRGLA